MEHLITQVRIENQALGDEELAGVELDRVCGYTALRGPRGPVLSAQGALGDGPVADGSVWSCAQSGEEGAAWSRPLGLLCFLWTGGSADGGFGWG